MIVWILAIAVVAEQVLDYWTASKILARGGVELNPVMVKLMQLLGRKSGLIIGKLYASVFVLAGAYLGWFDNKTGTLLLIFLAVFYAVIVLHNIDAE